MGNIKKKTNTKTNKTNKTNKTKTNNGPIKAGACKLYNAEGGNDEFCSLTTDD